MSPRDRGLARAAIQAVKEFNESNALGVSVRVWPGARPDGRSIDTKTRSEAQVLSGHTAVVWVEGVSGCIALSHVEVIK